jgi:hypothetical protein
MNNLFIEIKNASMKVTMLLLIVISGVNFGYGSTTYINTSITIDSVVSVTEYSDTLLIGPNAQLRINGSWYITSSYVHIDSVASVTGEGTIFFSNPSDFDIGGATMTNSKIEVNGGKVNLDINICLENPSNMSLIGKSLYIGKQFKFNGKDAHVILSDQNLIFDQNATASGSGNSSYIVTDSTGVVVKELQNGSFSFPIGWQEDTGSSTDYTPAIVVANSGVNTSVRVFDYNKTVSYGMAVDYYPEGIDRTWEIISTSDSSSDAITLQHNRNTEGADFNPLSSFITRYAGVAPNILGGKRSETVWDWTGNINTSLQGTAPNSISNKRVLALNQSNYYTKGLADNTPLPVDLLEFNAQLVSRSKVHLTWSTAREINNDYFLIQRSDNNIFGFRQVGSQTKGVHFSNKPKNYNALDTLFPKSVKLSYYRLNQVDFNGKSKYSKVVAVHHDKTESELISPVVFPIPAKDYINVKIGGSISVHPINYKVYNTIGKELVSGITETNKVIDISKIPNGLYTLALEDQFHSIYKVRFSIKR